MSESATVVPIKPPRRDRKRKPFAFPKHIAVELSDLQARVYEALAVAKLLAAHAMDTPGSNHYDSEHVDISIRGTDALVRLLTPVSGINDALDLEHKAREREVANG